LLPVQGAVADPRWAMSSRSQRAISMSSSGRRFRTAPRSAARWALQVQGPRPRVEPAKPWAESGQLAGVQAGKVRRTALRTTESSPTGTRPAVLCPRALRPRDLCPTQLRPRVLCPPEPWQPEPCSLTLWQPELCPPEHCPTQLCPPELRHDCEASLLRCGTSFAVATVGPAKARTGESTQVLAREKRPLAVARSLLLGVPRAVRVLPVSTTCRSGVRTSGAAHQRPGWTNLLLARHRTGVAIPVRRCVCRPVRGPALPAKAQPAGMSPPFRGLREMPRLP